MSKQQGNISLTIVIIILVVLIAGTAIYSFTKKSSDEPISVTTSSTGDILSIPDEILQNKFGFLVGDPEQADFVNEVKAGWARPHPGFFLWDLMQSDVSSEIDFQLTDQMIKDLQEKNLGILITLWPFADWDQKNNPNASSCKVADNDEFLPHENNQEKPDQAPKDDKLKPEGQMPYISQYRCNPHDWDAYKKWVQAIIQRYNGDGIDDMPGLKYPVLHYEVLNEPDLSWKSQEQGMQKESSLTFYKQEPTDYAKLLINSYKYIKEIDENAQVLIAGAAGGDDQFLDFYRQVFEIENAKKSFDISNIHCISNDEYENFNVAPYKKMLEEFGLNLPIWVTEAEALIHSNNTDANASQTYSSTKQALQQGAKKIFYTKPKFESQMEAPKLPGQKIESLNINVDLAGKSPKEIYKIIIKDNK